MESLNFKSEVSKDAGKFSALPEDRYTVKVIDAKYALSKEKQTPQIAVTLEVQDGPFKNRKVWHNFTWTKKAAPFIFGFMKAVKSPLVEEDDVTPHQVAASLIGGMCTVYAAIEATNTGTSRNKLSDFKGIDGAPAPTGGKVAPATTAAPAQQAPTAGGNGDALFR